MSSDNSSAMQHRMFPAIVAISFGALFGLGSLAIRPSLIEGMVADTPIETILSVFAAPLGTITRIMIALVMALLGAVIGAVFARRLIRVEATRDEREPCAQAEPIALPPQAAPENNGYDASHDEQREDGGLEAEADETPNADLLNRRRSLFAADDAEHEPDHGARTLLRRKTPQIFDVSQIDLDGFESVPSSREDAADSAGNSGERDMDGPNLNPSTLASENDAEDTEASGSSDVFVTETSSREPALQMPRPASAPKPQSTAPQTSAAERLRSSALEDLSHVELLERLALSLRLRRESITHSAKADRPTALMATASAQSNHFATLSQSCDLSVTSTLVDQPRSDFVQIENSDTIDDDGKPVVVFRGRENVQSDQAQPQGVHRPGATAAWPGADGRDNGSAESEHALRAALATLQRMSGTG